MCCSGISSQGSVVTSMGRKSKKEGINVHIQLIYFAIRQKLTQHCKNNYIPTKISKYKQYVKRKKIKMLTAALQDRNHHLYFTDKETGLGLQG